MCDSENLNWVFLDWHTWLLFSIFADTTTKITRWNLVRCSGYTPPWQNSRLTLVRRKTLIFRRKCCTPNVLMHVNAVHDTFKYKAVNIRDADTLRRAFTILYTLWQLSHRFTMLTLKIKAFIIRMKHNFGLNDGNVVTVSCNMIVTFLITNDCEKDLSIT